MQHQENPIWENLSYFDSEQAIGHINIKTGECVFFHKNEKYWSYKKYTRQGLDQPTGSKWPGKIKILVLSYKIKKKMNLYNYYDIFSR